MNRSEHLKKINAPREKVRQFGVENFGYQEEYITSNKKAEPPIVVGSRQTINLYQNGKITTTVV